MAGTILAVDDSRTMRDLIEFVLSSAGYQMVVATDGEDGLDKLSTMRPNLVITDINMPKMDGYGFMRAVRGNEATRSLPILVLTTESDPAAKAKIKEAGANGWIAKPFNPAQLVETVKRFTCQT
ncbi:MAG: response regulator [Bauldia sp.]